MSALTVPSTNTLMRVANSKKAADALRTLLTALFAGHVIAKGAVDLVSDSNIALTGDAQNIDGVVAGAGHIVLCVGQTDPIENGPYVVAAGAWTRATSASAGTAAHGFKYVALSGTDYTGKSLVCTSDSGADVVGTDELTFVVSSAEISLEAGNGLGLAGVTLSVNVDGNTIEINADTLRVKDLGVTTAKINDLAVTTGKIANDAVDKDKVNADVAGSGLGQNADGSLEVKVDGVGLEVAADTLQLKNLGVVTGKINDLAVTTGKIANGAVTVDKLGALSVETSKIAADAVDKDKINADVAGSGLGQNVDGSLEVKVDGTGIEINADTLRLKDSGVTTAKIAADAVDKTKVNADVAGAGLEQAVDGSLQIAATAVDDETLTGGGGSTISMKCELRPAALAQTPADANFHDVPDSFHTMGNNSKALFEARAVMHNVSDDQVNVYIRRAIFERAALPASTAQVGASIDVLTSEEGVTGDFDFSIDAVAGAVGVKVKGIDTKNCQWKVQVTWLEV